MTAAPPTRAFDPAAHARFRFLDAGLDAAGTVTLRYALDDAVAFVEEVDLPVPGPLGEADRARVAPLVALLHLAAGVSYFKTAAPPAVDAAPLAPAAVALAEALYSEGLGEFAYRNGIALPRPAFPRAGGADAPAPPPPRAEGSLLVPVGGGKDSVVALEVARRSGRPFALFSVGDAAPIAATAAVAGVPRLIARRRLDPGLRGLNAAGARNGHVPVTAIVSLIAVLTAALNGYDAVAMANERSASAGNLEWEGVRVNHQFSKGFPAEQLLRAALAEAGPAPDCFSLLRPASELLIARAFAGLHTYHGAFTSCNAVFRLDPAARAGSWCRQCPKCRFVFLALAPFLAPEDLVAIFGADLLDDPAQYEGFAMLTATGGHKPFECVGEEEESLAAFRMLAAQPAWRDHAVVARFAREVPGDAVPDGVLELAGPHAVPPDLLAALRAVLGA